MSRQPIISPTKCTPSDGCGLYVHIPFCETKCGYCDFYSIPADGQPIDAAVNAIVTELGGWLGELPEAVRTVFIGGGTPTVLSAARLEQVLLTVRQVAPGDLAEFTVEANPATVDAEKARLLARHGVGRVSLGAQSFHENELSFLERLHRPEDIAPALDALRGAGIANLNLDLIFGIGGQTVSSWRESLQRALDLNPAHLACYGLTYEPGTALTRQLYLGRAKPCDEDLEAEMYLVAVDLLADAGFEHYEISNFARPGRRCLHNLVYWGNEPYIGVGPSAAGYVHGRRYKNVPNLGNYIKRISETGSAVIEDEELTSRDRAIETVMLQLRLIEGIDLDAFRLTTEVDLASEASIAIGSLHSQGLIETSGGRLRLTRKGLLAADAVISELALALDRGREVSLPVIHGGSRTPAL